MSYALLDLLLLLVLRTAWDALSHVLSMRDAPNLAQGATRAPLVLSSALHLEPAPWSDAAPSARAAPPPSAAPSGATSAAARPLHRAPRAGISGREPGASDVHDPWGLMIKQNRNRTNDCRIGVIDLHLIERLAERVRQQLDADEITPSIMVQALHHKGLDLAETRAFERDALSTFEQAKVIRFEVTDEDSARLERHLKRIQAQRQHATTQLPRVQRSIIRLGLVEASTRASFPAFCEAVRLLLPPRDPKARPAVERGEALARSSQTRRV